MQRMPSPSPSRAKVDRGIGKHWTQPLLLLKAFPSIYKASARSVSMGRMANVISYRATLDAVPRAQSNIAESNVSPTLAPGEPR